MIFLWVALKGAVEMELVLREPRGVDWIGFWLSAADFRLGISEKRARWIREWVSKTFEKGFAEMRDFHAVLGGLGFAVSALDCLRFFTAPFFACAAAVPRGAYLGPAFVAEAKAEGQHECVGPGASTVVLVGADAGLSAVGLRER